MLATKVKQAAIYISFKKADRKKPTFFRAAKKNIRRGKITDRNTSKNIDEIVYGT